jgi:hypothetical protein
MATPSTHRRFYHGYGKGRATPEESGVLEAAFDGSMAGSGVTAPIKSVTVTLRTRVTMPSNV